MCYLLDDDTKTCRKFVLDRLFTYLCHKKLLSFKAFHEILNVLMTVFFGWVQKLEIFRYRVHIICWNTRLGQV